MRPIDPSGALTGAALIVLGTFAFAVNVIIAPALYASGSDPLTMITFRSAVFALVLTPALYVLKQPIALPTRERTITIGLGLLFTVQSLCFFTAISLIPVSVGTLIEYTYPFQLAIAGRILYGERLTARRLLAMGGALLGLALVLEIAGLDTGLDSTGVGLMVLASVLLSAKILLSHRVLFSVDSRRFGLHLSATVGATGVLAFTLTPLAPAWPQSGVGWALLTLAPVSSLVGVLAFYTGLSRIGPVRASMLANSEPVFILLLALVLLGENFTLRQGVGAALVVLCVLVFQLDRTRPG